MALAFNHPEMVRYRETMEQIAAAARSLDQCEPTMAKLVEQYSDTVSFGFVGDPSFAREVIQDRSGNLATQMRLAKAVIDFVREWRKLRVEARAETQRQVDALARGMETENGI